MKLKNSPERKRQRQLSALARLKRQWGSINLPFFAEREIKILEQRTATNLRDVRTKKYRGQQKSN